MSTLLKTYTWRTCDSDQSNRLIILSTCNWCYTLNAPHVEMSDDHAPLCLVCGKENVYDSDSFDVGDWIGSIDRAPHDSFQIVAFDGDDGTPIALDQGTGREFRIPLPSVHINRIGLIDPPLGLFLFDRSVPWAERRLLQVVGYTSMGSLACRNADNEIYSVGRFNVDLHYHCHRSTCPNLVCQTKG